MSYWQNKVAIVTGGSSGLGKAIARALVEQGGRIVIVARNAEKLNAAAAEIEKAGSQIVPLSADITRDDDVSRIIEQTIRRFGRIDLLVNCAGASARGALSETGTAEFVRLMDLNLTALVRCTRAALSQLLTSKGHVVNIGSLA